MPDLIPFQFGTHEIRVQIDENGTPWWIAKDVCDVLGIQNVSQAVDRLSPLESRAICFTYTGLQELKILFVNEQGLYRLIFRSKKPEAKKFQAWVFGEVLPQIRKTGKYEAPAASIPPADAQLATINSIADLLTRLGQLTERDTLMLADQVRNVAQSGQRLLASPQDYGFSVAERVEQLGYHPSRKEQAAIYGPLGRKVAAEWRAIHGSEPLKEARFVDGAQRQVSWYPSSAAPWVDTIILPLELDGY